MFSEYGRNLMDRVEMIPLPLTEDTDSTIH